MSAHAKVELIVLAGNLHDDLSLDKAQLLVVKKGVQALVKSGMHHPSDLLVDHTYRVRVLTVGKGRGTRYRAQGTLLESNTLRRKFITMEAVQQ